MIQFKRKLYGLDKLRYDYIDTDSRSRNIFRLLEFPETFNLGKNQFKLLANNEVLVKNSRIYIDIVDANGEAIYYEISPIANKDNSRSVIVYIYPNTPAGNCTVRIASRLGIDPRSKEKIYYNDNIIDEPNVLWSKVVNVSPYIASEARIKFLTDPVISYKERIEQLQVISGSTRLTNLYAGNNDTISLISVVEPKQLNPAWNDVEISDVNKSIPTQPQITSGSGVSKNVNIPYFSGLTTIASNNFVFSSSMAGGMIYVNGIDVDYPREAINTSSFFGLSYSASIINVINDNLIEVFPAFGKSFSYNTADGSTKLFSVNRISNHSNFTASFFDSYNLSASLTTQSFLEMNAYGIEPISGIVDTVKVSYKPINSFGDFRNLGDFKVVGKNLLTDSSSISFTVFDGITEKSIGTFPNGLTDFNRYWTSGSVGEIGLVVYDRDTINLKVSDGLFIKSSVSTDPSKYIFFRPKPQYSTYVQAGTEMLLKFSSFLEAATLDGKLSQIDVYITGSEVYSDIVSDRLYYNPVKNYALGNHIGSITSENGVLRNTTIPFIVRSSGNVYPVFVIRSGHWHFGKIELSARDELGFTPNQCRIYVPLDSIDKESELIFKVQYQDKVGIRSETETKLYGLYFSGSSPIQFQDIANVPSILTTGILSYSGSYQSVTYITGSESQVDNNPLTIRTMIFPVFKDDSNQTTYSGSNYAVGLSFHIDTLIYGYTGSALNPFDSYTWAGSLEGRAIVNANTNGGQPYIYNVVAVSGSSLNSIGTFGSGDPANNLDSWYNVVSVIHGGGNQLSIRYRVITSSSFAWTINTTATCKIIKYETKILT